MKKQKQKKKVVRSYKVNERVYEKAVERVKKEKTTVSKKISDFLEQYIL